MLNEKDKSRAREGLLSLISLPGVGFLREEKPISFVFYRK